MNITMKYAEFTARLQNELDTNYADRGIQIIRAAGQMALSRVRFDPLSGKDEWHELHDPFVAIVSDDKPNFRQREHLVALGGASTGAHLDSLQLFETKYDDNIIAWYERGNPKQDWCRLDVPGVGIDAPRPGQVPLKGGFGQLEVGYSDVQPNVLMINKMPAIPGIHLLPIA